MKAARVFAALGDSTRTELVTKLSRGPASVSELAEPYSMSLRAVLKHLQVLEDAGVVATVKEGRVRRCWLQEQSIAESARWLMQVSQRWERRLDRLEEYTSTGRRP